jgi:hypothetical protein
MAMHLRSACAPLLLMIALAVFLLLGVHDLDRHKHAACVDSLLALSVSSPGSDFSAGSRGAAYLSRFDRAEVWGCGGPDTGRHGGIAP